VSLHDERNVDIVAYRLAVWGKCYEAACAILPPRRDLETWSCNYKLYSEAVITPAVNPIETREVTSIGGIETRRLPASAMALGNKPRKPTTGKELLWLRATALAAHLNR